MTENLYWVRSGFNLRCAGKINLDTLNFGSYLVRFGCCMACLVQLLSAFCYLLILSCVALSCLHNDFVDKKVNSWRDKKVRKSFYLQQRIILTKLMMSRSRQFHA